MIASLVSSRFQYRALYKPNQIIAGSGQVAVITGWTVKQAIAKRLADHEYGAIGQLYSPTRGISLLIRNLLVNPHVRFLVVMDGTREDRNAGSSQCLLDFLQRGFEAGKSDLGRDCWVVRSAVTGYIDREIPATVLEHLRSSLTWVSCSSIETAIQHVQSFAAQGEQEPWGDPLQFPLVESVPTVLPGPRYGHRIEGRTVADTWVKIIHRIKTTGTIRPTGYDGQWQELINLVAVVTAEPEGFYFPEPNYLPCDRPFIQEYIAQILDDAPYQEGVKYTYGQRLRSWFGRDQVEQVIEKLIGEIDAASGVMSLWDVQDHEKGGSPCLNHLWVRVVEGELSLTATLRSNDMFSAWPANAMGLRALQQHIRDEIGRRSDYDLTLGPLMTISQSAHIYDDTWENADKLITQHYGKICETQRRDYADPSGNFLIEVQGDEIVVSQTTPGSGEVVQTYRDRQPLPLIRAICAHCPALRPDHAGYLGLELQKAFGAMEGGRVYQQDR